MADFSSSTIGSILADQSGGLWAVADELLHLKGGAVTSKFAVNGTAFQSISQDPDGSVWVATRRGSDQPFCHVTRLAVRCFGKNDGIPISRVQSVLADGHGGFWLGGETALVHWQGGVSEVYPVKAEIVGLALAPDGSPWVGIGEGEGLGLAHLKDGAVKPLITPTFDGSKLSVTSLMFDRDGNLGLAPMQQGSFVSTGIVWSITDTRRDCLAIPFGRFLKTEKACLGRKHKRNRQFRDPRVTTFSALQGLGKDLAAGILASRDGTIWVANNGSLDRIRNETVSSIRRANGLPGDQVAAMLEDHAGNFWVGVDDELYLFKDGQFRRLPAPNHQALGMVVGMQRISTAMSGRNVQAIRESLSAYAISECARYSFRRNFRLDITSLRIHAEEFG